ncbi:orexin receptor type 2-like [Saccostrea cucullata]|uniref:orexin receptor type 2-like n=1 Tax=Saccostrea cuccullata TaxID=36930 RepID=UPI002ED1A97E
MSLSVNSTDSSNNSSSLDQDPDLLLQELNDRTALRFLPVIIYMALLMLVGTFGNIMVCIVYLRKRIKNSSDYFILNLAFLDLLTCVFGIPVEIADLRYPYMFYAPAACKLLRTIESFTNMGSTLTLIAIAVDRYKRICKLGERFSNEKAKRLCIGAIVTVPETDCIGAMTGWPAAMVFGKKSVDVGIPGAIAVDCSTADEMRKTIYPLLYYGIVMLYFIICVIFVTFVYVRISLFIRKGKSKQKKETRHALSPLPPISSQPISEEQSSESSRQGEIRISDKDKTNGGRMVNTIKVTRTTTIFIVVTVAFIVSYLPFLVVMVTRNIKKNFEDILSPAAEVLYKFCLKSYFINNAINPIIYSFLNRNFRTEAIRVIKCK